MTAPSLPDPRVEWDGDRPEFVHVCNGVPTREPIPLRSGGWTADRADDSVSPSIDCRACGTHGFWTAGEWRTA